MQNILDLLLVAAEPQNRRRRARVGKAHLLEGLGGKCIAVGDAGQGLAPVEDDEPGRVVRGEDPAQVQIVHAHGGYGVPLGPQGIDELFRSRKGRVLLLTSPGGIEIVEHEHRQLPVFPLRHRVDGHPLFLHSIPFNYCVITYFCSSFGTYQRITLWPIPMGAGSIPRTRALKMGNASGT
jgi:hypothetical protein